MDQSAIYPETICEGVVGAFGVWRLASGVRVDSSTKRLKTGTGTSWEQPCPRHAESRPHHYAKRCGRGFRPTDLSHVNGTHC
jgi:hypothetical protein